MCTAAVHAACNVTRRGRQPCFQPPPQHQPVLVNSGGVSSGSGHSLLPPSSPSDISPSSSKLENHRAPPPPPSISEYLGSVILRHRHRPPPNALPPIFVSLPTPSFARRGDRTGDRRDRFWESWLVGCLVDNVTISDWRSMIDRWSVTAVTGHR